MQKTITTPLGGFTTETSTTIKEIESANFTSDLQIDISETKNKLANKEIQLARMLYISKNDLNTMLQDNADEVLIMYMTSLETGTTTTFTVISADRGMNAMLNHKKWKLTSTLGYPWVDPDTSIPSSGTEPNIDILDIYNPALVAHSHKFEASSKFIANLQANNAKLFDLFEAGKIATVRIATALKSDLTAFEDTNGVLICLNYAAEKRMIKVTSGGDETPTLVQFVSLTFIGVSDQWKALTNLGKEKLTLSGFCPPDCPTYNNS